MNDLKGEAAKRFQKALYIISGLLIILLITIIVLKIIVSRFPKVDDNDGLDELVDISKRAKIINKVIIILTFCLIGIIVLLCSIFAGKSAVLRGKNSSDATMRDINSSMWNKITKIGSTVVIFVSLKLAAFITRSILKTQAEKEFKKSDNYKYVLMFILIWILCLILCIFIAIFCYSYYLNRKGNLDWVMKKYISTSYSVFMNQFTPNSIILFIGFGLLIILNIILMIYYIETKDNDNIVLDKAGEKQEVADAENEDLEEEDQDDEQETMDPNGIGFVYNLIDLIDQLDVVICLLIIWIVDWIRL